MNTRERFLKILNFETPDRLPMIEWAHWWDLTYQRWQGEGLPAHLTDFDLYEYFGLERLECLYIWAIDSSFKGLADHGAPIITDEKSYLANKHFFFTDHLIEDAIKRTRKLKPRHDDGEIAIRVWLDGFFWFPRSLLGIENHLYAFFDEPDLMHRINEDLAEFNIRALKAVFEIITPEFIGIAEDMSYNSGPMLSKDMYDEFIAPYYAKYMPLLKSKGIKVLVDTDGDVMPMIPWLIDSEIDGIYPLERQAGVDVSHIRKLYPRLILMGAFDKMVMSKDEAAMRKEFERLLPVMRLGGFIPSTDHQVPPEVSLENYRIYTRLYEEYCIKACVMQ